MVSESSHSERFSKAFDQFGNLVKQRRPVYTIVKYSSTHYDLVNYYTREVYLEKIPFKLTAERLMEQLNSGVTLSRDRRHRLQEACHRYESLTMDRPFLEAGTLSDNPHRRRVAEARLDLCEARLAEVEDYLFIR